MNNDGGINLKEKWKLFVVPHFHFDVAWIKKYEDYLEVAFNNILDVLHLIEKHPEYRFCLDQVVLIEPFLEKNQEVSEIFKEKVREGRIEIVCGMYTMPDANIPSGEFLVRQFLFGKHFFKEKIGIDVKCGWMIDSFGHPNQLPQILKKCGFEYYVFCRGAPKNLDKTEFLWKGLDGTEILTHWMIGTYIAGWMPPQSGEILRKIGMELPYITRALLYAQSMRWLKVPIEKGVEKILAVFSFLKNFASTKNTFIPNGADFTPPQCELLDVIKEINKNNAGLEAFISTPSNFFEKLKREKRKLPTISGEFNPVFQGVYSSRISLKRKNRIAENLLLIAEKFATLASVLGLTYPKDSLEDATKFILFNHFHDIICGCGVDEVYLDAMERFERSIECSKDILKKSLEFIVGNIDTQGQGTPIVVFNPLPWIRTDVAEVEVQIVNPKIKEISLVDHNGKPIPFQVIQEEKYPDEDLKSLKIIFIAENVPSIGYNTYFIIPRKINSKNLSEIKAGENFIENEFIRVTVNPDKGGAITSIYDKENDYEVIDVKNFYGNVLISEKDFGDLYEFNGNSDGMATKNTLKIDKMPEKGKAEFSSDCRGRIWLEIGPIMAKYTINGAMEDMMYESAVILYRKIRRINFKLHLNFTGRNKRIRLCMPLNVDRGKIFHEVPYGVAERGEGEYPAQNWVDYSNRKYGVSLINNGIPGNSIVQGVALLTLLRSVDRVLESHPAGEKARENGYHEFSYALYPHKGDWVDGETYKVAMEFNNPLITIKATSHQGKMPRKFSFVSASPQNIVITTLKRKGKLLILRFYETSGRDTEATISLFKPFKKVWITNLLEEKMKKLKHKSDTVKLCVKKFEIVTLAFELEN